MGLGKGEGNTRAAGGSADSGRPSPRQAAGSSGHRTCQARAKRPGKGAARSPQAGGSQSGLHRASERKDPGIRTSLARRRVFENYNGKWTSHFASYSFRSSCCSAGKERFTSNMTFDVWKVKASCFPSQKRAASKLLRRDVFSKGRDGTEHFPCCPVSKHWAVTRDLVASDSLTGETGTPPALRRVLFGLQNIFRIQNCNICLRISCTVPTNSVSKNYSVSRVFILWIKDWESNIKK